MFRHCFSLTEITIPDSVTFIGEAAFTGCKFLKNIIIPPSVVKIQPHAFSYCPLLDKSKLLDWDLEIFKSPRPSDIGAKPLVAIDISGYISHDSLYFNTVKRIIYQYNISEALVWNSVCKKVHYDQLQSIINLQEGRNNCDPSVIIEAIINDCSLFRDHLVIITSGYCNYSSIDKIKYLINRYNIHFKSIMVYHILDIDNFDWAEAFQCECTVVLMNKNYGQHEIRNDFSSLDLFDIISTPHHFEKFSSILLQEIKKVQPFDHHHENLKFKLMNLKKRITESGNLSSKSEELVNSMIKILSLRLRPPVEPFCPISRPLP